MRKLSAFIFVSLDGYFKDQNNGISWHKHGMDESEYSLEKLKSDNILLFGRITYELMSNYWTSSMAFENDTLMAEGMNKADKIVFSQTLLKAEWNNTNLLQGNIINEIIKLKQMPGKDMTILGSGSILTQFSEYGLIDEYQIMVDPVVLGAGTSIFSGLKNRLDLKLTMSKTFKSGVVLLCHKKL